MDFNYYLCIPDRMIIGKKLPKNFFLKNFELNGSEKKVLSEEIIGIELLANIKPSNSNVPPYEDDIVTYREIQVMTCEVSNGQLEKLQSKVVSLVQKYIPHPILLIIEDETTFIVNTCEKRINMNDKNKRTIEQVLTSPILSKLYTNELSETFLRLMHFGALDSSNLQTLYSSFSNAILKCQSARLTGTFSAKRGVRTEEELTILQDIERMRSEILKLSNQLQKETQLKNKVALNMVIQELRRTIETKTNLLATL